MEIEYTEELLDPVTPHALASTGILAQLESIRVSKPPAIRGPRGTREHRPRAIREPNEPKLTSHERRMQLFREVYGDLQMRPGTSDEWIAWENLRCYRNMDLEARAVVDIGGYIGTFAKYAKWRGAVSVVSFEPDPDNFEVYQRNTEGDDRISGFGVAVLEPERSGQVELYTSRGACRHSMLKTRIGHPKDVFMVDGWPIDGIVKRVLANNSCEVSVKLDIEGYEHPIIEAYQWPPEVRCIGLELHEFQDGQSALTVKKLESQGFESIREVKAVKSGGARIEVFKR